MPDTRENLQELLDAGFIQQVEYDNRIQNISPAPPHSRVLSQQTSNSDPYYNIEEQQSKTQTAISSHSPSVVLSSFTGFKRPVFTSALVICPPLEFWEQFVDVKKHHMNPRIKRAPYPHITLLAPFVPYNLFEKAGELLFERLKTIQPFRMEINSFKLYCNNTSNTLYLDPEVSPPTIVQDLQKICVQEFPSCVKGEFDPHIGVGYFKNKREAVQCQRKYQAQWSPIHFNVQEIYMVSRISDVSPFTVRHVVSLGGQHPTPLITPQPE